MANDSPTPNDAAPPASPRPPVSLSPVVWLALLGALFAGAFVLSQRVPMWAPGMFYGFRQPPSLPAAGLVTLLLALQIGASHALWRAAHSGRKRREASSLAALCALMLCVNLALRSGENGGLARLAILTINPAAGGYYLAAFDADNLPNWLADYPRLMHGHHHVETHPPGGVALMRLLREQARRSPFSNSVAQEALLWSPGIPLEGVAAFCRRVWRRDYQGYDVAAAWWAALLLIVCAALLPAAVYALARPLCGPPAAAHAAALTALVPSFALLSPALDMLTALCAALTLALCVHGLLKNKIALVLLAGLVAGVGMVFSFAMLAPLLMAGGFFLWQGRQGSVPWRRVWTSCGALAAGVLAMILIFAALGVPWVTIYHLTHQFQTKVMIDYHRPWQLWMWFNLVDFFYFLGLPCCVLLLAALLRGRDVEESTRGQLDGLLLPALGVILLVNFGANVWAESARIWMLFVPPLMVGAGFALQRLAAKSSAASLVPLLVMLAQAAQLLAMAAALNVWSF